MNNVSVRLWEIVYFQTFNPYHHQQQTHLSVGDEEDRREWLHVRQVSYSNLTDSERANEGIVAIQPTN